MVTTLCIKYVQRFQLVWGICNLSISTSDLGNFRAVWGGLKTHLKDSFDAFLCCFEVPITSRLKSLVITVSKGIWFVSFWMSKVIIKCLKDRISGFERSVSWSFPCLFTLIRQSRLCQMHNWHCHHDTVTIGTVTIGTVTTSDRARHCNWTRLCRSPPRRTLTCELCRRHDPSRPPPRYDQHHKTFLLYLTGLFMVIQCWCSSGWSPYLSDTRPVS